MKDLFYAILELWAMRKEYWQTFTQYRRHRKHKFFRTFMSVAYHDKKSGFKRAHPDAASTVHHFIMLGIMAAILFIWWLCKKPDWFLGCCAIVCIAAFLLMLIPYFRVRMELCEIAIRASRIYTKHLEKKHSKKASMAAAKAAIQDGSIVNMVLEERKKILEKLAKDAEKLQDDVLKQVIEDAKKRYEEALAKIGQSESSTPAASTTAPPAAPAQPAPPTQPAQPASEPDQSDIVWPISPFD